MEFSLDPTSYADFSSVNYLKNELGAIIAHIGMAERNKSLSDRTSKISKRDVEDSVKLMEQEKLNELKYYEYDENYDKDQPIHMYKQSDDNPTYQEEEYGINYLLNYVYLYYKVVSNYEVRFRTEFNETKYNFLGILGELGFDISNDLENNINFEIILKKQNITRLSLNFNKLNDLLKKILSGDTKSNIDAEIESSRGGGMIGGNPVGIAAVMAKPVAAIWHLGRVAFLRDKVLDKLKYIYIVDGKLDVVFNKLKVNQTTKLNKKDMNVIFLGKILNAELVNIFRTCYYSLLRTRGAGLNKIGDMLLKVGMCKSRIVYFVLYNINYDSDSDNNKKIFLVYMYLRPRGVKNIYVHPFKYDKDLNLENLISGDLNTIDEYKVSKITFENILLSSHFGVTNPAEDIKDKIKTYFKENHQFTMSYDIDYLVNKIDYAVKCEKHALSGKNKYDCIAARIITLRKDKRYLFRTRRTRQNRGYFTIPDKIITHEDYRRLGKKIPEMLYLFNILKKGLDININRDREELIRLVKEKEDEEIIDSALHEPMLRSRLYTVTDNDIIPLQNNWMDSSSTAGGGRKKTKKNNKVIDNNKMNNNILTKKVRKK